MLRQTWPWFKSYLWRNDDGRSWVVTFKSDTDYSTSLLLPVEACISRDTGEIVGFTVYDEILEHTAQQDWLEHQERGKLHVKLDP